MWRRMAVAAASAGVARAVTRRRRRVGMSGRVALVTGGSAGLGLAIARRLAADGARVAVCGRDEETLHGAADDLARHGAAVDAHVCDVADRDAVEHMVAAIEATLGPVEVLVNNAGVIGVGEVDGAAHDRFAEMLDVMFWGVVHPTLAVLPGMRARRFGRVATITSIGARIAAPQLVPYSCAKHAAHAFSQGMGAELAGEGVRFSTVVPGLMHTGSHRAVQVTGGRAASYTWFALGGASRLTATAPDRAADRVVEGLRHADPYVLIGVDAKVVTRLEGLAPATASRVLGVAARVLPDSGPADVRRSGWELENPLTRSKLTQAGREAAADLQQHRPQVREPASQRGEGPPPTIEERHDD